MRRFGSALLVCALLAIGGFTAAVVAGTSPAALLQSTSTTTTTGSTTSTTGTTTTSTSTSTSTSTTTTTTTTPTTTTTVTTPPPTPKKVTICHRTGSKKHPYRKIRLSRNALKAHFRHGDLIAVTGVACPSQVVKTDGKGHKLKVKAKSKSKSKSKSGSDDKGKNKGKGKGK